MIKLYAKSRMGFYAEAEYDSDQVIVKAGGRVNTSQAQHIGKKGKASKYRYNREYVDKDGIIKKDCKFNSLSTAAEFVKGTATNGLLFWKVEKKLNIGKYLKQLEEYDEEKNI